MEIQKIMLFIRVCVLYAYYGYLTGLTNENLICLLEESLVMALFLHDTDTERIIYVQLGHVYKDIHPKLAKTIGLVKERIWNKKKAMLIYSVLGDVYQLERKYHVAIKYHERCLGIATEIGNRNVEGSAHGHLGHVYQSLRKYDEAIKYHEKRLSIATEIGDRNGEVKAYGSLGNAYDSLGKYHEAIEYYEKCLSIATELSDRNAEGSTYGNLGNAYHSLGKYHEAIEYHEKHLCIATEIGDRNEEGFAYGNLGNAYDSLGKYHEAIKYHEKHVLIATEIGDRNVEGEAYGNLGKAYQSLCKYHEAIECHEKHLCIATEIGDRNGEGSTYGNLGNAYQSLDKYHEAIEYHQKHLCIATEIGDRKGEGGAYGNLGNAYQSLGKYHEAIEYHEKHLCIATEIGDRNGEGSAYGNLGKAYQSLGKYHEAIEYHKKCLCIATEIGNRNLEGGTYGHLGNVYRSLGKYHEAIEYHKKCLCIATEIGDRNGEGRTYGNLGNDYRSLGKYHEAIKYHKKHLFIATEIGDRNGKGIAYGSLGNAYQSVGKYHEAIDNHEKHLCIATEIGDRNGEGSAYGNLGNAYQDLGKYHDAIDNHKKHLCIATEIGDRNGEDNAYGNLGNAYQSLGKYHEAIEYHEKFLCIATEIGDRNGEANAYGNLGNAYQSLGKYHEAIEYQEKRLCIATEIGDRNGEGIAYGSLGNAYQSLGKYHEATEYNEKRLCIATEIDDRIGEGTAHHNIGVCYCNEDNAYDPRKSKEHFYKSIQSFELSFDNLKEKDQFKISFFDTFIKPYEVLSSLCIRTGQTEEALLVSERRRARALGDLLSLKYSLNKKTTSKRGSLKLTEVNDMMVPTSCILFYDVNLPHCWFLAHKNPPFDFSIPKTSAEDENEYNTDLITHLKEKGYDHMKVRERMDCEDRSLGILECEKESSVKPPTPESSQVTERETTKGSEIGEKVSPQARCAYEEDFKKPLELLFELLIAPVQHKLIQEEIIIIPDGPLFMVPFAALRDPNTGKFLSEMKRIRLSPSLTTLKLLQESSDDRHYKSGALIVGNPEIGEVKFRGKKTSFVKLPGAEEEAKEIAKLLEVEPLTGRQATKEAVLQKLQVGVSVIHFAAHGLSENGQIVLAPSTSSATNSIPDEHDYILTMQEAQESGLRAQLVVLSCCHSGRGEIKAEGVVGMTRAFLAAGARAVLASLWAIDDNTTMIFMKTFYTHLKNGESASKSLQQAMKEMRETGYNEPRDWAAFFLIGDDVSISI